MILVMPKTVGLLAAWLAAVVVAVAVGVFAVSTVGASIRGRGPLGSEVVRDASGDPQGSVRVTPGATAVRHRFSGDYGAFVTECRGVVAYGIRAVPARGWRIVSYEKGPDDDVDAVFSNGRHSVDLEIFCNRGRPTLAELERHTLGADD